MNYVAHTPMGVWAFILKIGQIMKKRITLIEGVSYEEIIKQNW